MAGTAPTTWKQPSDDEVVQAARRFWIASREMDAAFQKEHDEYARYNKLLTTIDAGGVHRDEGDAVARECGYEHGMPPGITGKGGSVYVDEAGMLRLTDAGRERLAQFNAKFGG